MAFVTVVPAVPGNACLGSDKHGEIVRKFKCLKGYDEQGDPIETCAAWRKFRVQCPKLNQQCSSLSEAWVAAVTVCNQRLF